jgi:hypothetical protein
VRNFSPLFERTDIHALCSIQHFGLGVRFRRSTCERQPLICQRAPREEARRDVFEYIELFYNPKRKHTNNGMLSPVDFEQRQLKLEKAGV